MRNPHLHEILLHKKQHTRIFKEPAGASRFRLALSRSIRPKSSRFQSILRYVLLSIGMLSVCSFACKPKYILWLAICHPSRIVRGLPLIRSPSNGLLLCVIYVFIVRIMKAEAGQGHSLPQAIPQGWCRRLRMCLTLGNARSASHPRIRLFVLPSRAILSVCHDECKRAPTRTAYHDWQTVCMGASYPLVYMLTVPGSTWNPE